MIGAFAVRRRPKLCDGVDEHARLLPGRRRSARNVEATPLHCRPRGVDVADDADGQVDLVGVRRGDDEIEYSRGCERRERGDERVRARAGRTGTA